jgi:hypothetical protein
VIAKARPANDVKIERMAHPPGRSAGGF